jgi:hypothetical protein
LVVVDER